MNNSKRIGRVFVWVHPTDCDPPHSLDMQSERDANKVSFLREAFERDGFDKNMPALVGYPLDGRIQLMSGTHRHMAALQADIMLPVTLWLQSDIQQMWGTPLWNRAIEDISVKDLEKFNIINGHPDKIPYEPVILKGYFKD